MAEESNHGRFMPSEVLFDILKRVPMKSLCRFKCVSTLWRTLISDPDFVTSHWFHSKSQIVLGHRDHLTRDLKSSDVWISLYAADDGISMADLLRTPPHFRIPAGRHRCHVSRSVGGLTCITSAIHIKIFSPSTGAVHIELPLAVAERRWASLCFDPVTNQHKLLQSHYRYRNRIVENNVMVLSRVKLVDSRDWRSIESTPFFLVRVDARDEVCLDGVLYYTVRQFHEERVRARARAGPWGARYLVKFHVHEERFEIGSVDLNKRHERPDNWRQSNLVQVFGRRVAIVDYPMFERKKFMRPPQYRPDHSDKKSDSIQLWILDSLDMQQPWSGSKTVALPSKDILPRAGQFSLAGSVHSGEVLVFISTLNSESLCLLYNAKSGVFTKHAKIHNPIHGGCYPVYIPMLDQLSISDHQELTY